MSLNNFPLSFVFLRKCVYFIRGTKDSKVTKDLNVKLCIMNHEVLAVGNYAL